MLLKPLCALTVVAGVIATAVGLHRPSRECCPGMCLLSLVHASAVAEDKKDAKPALTGTWGKKEGQMKIAFGEKGVLTIAPHGDASVIGIVCKYKVEKGVVKVEVTDHEGKDEFKKKSAEKAPVGLKFTFTWKAKADTATLEDVKSDKDIDAVKNHLEGDYEKK